MKPSLISFVLFLYTIVSLGQTKLEVQFQLTKSKLDTLKVHQDKNFNAKTKGAQERFLNFNPVMLFDNDEDNLNILKDFGDLSQATIFTVYEADDSSKELEIWGIYGKESNITLTTGLAANTELYTPYEGGATRTPVLNTYVQMYKSETQNSIQSQPHTLIGSFSKDKQKVFKGAIAELIIYNRILNAKMRHIIETSLALKYGITLTNGKDYISSKKEEIYTMKDNNGFITRISGIGRDDAVDFYQKQSKSSNEASLLTIGIGEIVASNNRNNAQIKQHNFIIWGDNNQEATIETGEQLQSHIPLMKRQWKLQITGESAQKLETTVQVDISSILKQKKENASQYLLVIDASGTGSFLPEHTKYLDASSLENNLLTFNNIHWDTDGSGSDAFTFTKKPNFEITIEGEEARICDANDKGVIFYSLLGGIAPYSYELVKDMITVHQGENIEKIYPEKRIDLLGQGEYTLKVIDAFGSQQEAIYNLSILDPIFVDLGEDIQFRLDQQDVILDATVLSDDDITYQWDLDGGFFSDKPEVLITTPGVYTVTAISSGGCEATDSIEITDSFIQSFIVYPNKTTDGNYNIQIQLEEPQDVTIQIFDMAGRHISTVTKKNKSSYTIAGEQIRTTGLYNVVLQSAGLKTSRKLVVE